MCHWVTFPHTSFTWFQTGKPLWTAQCFSMRSSIKNKYLSQPEMNGQRENFSHYVTDFQEVDSSPRKQSFAFISKTASLHFLFQSLIKETKRIDTELTIAKYIITVTMRIIWRNYLAVCVGRGVVLVWKQKAQLSLLLAGSATVFCTKTKDIGKVGEADFSIMLQ